MDQKDLIAIQAEQPQAKIIALTNYEPNQMVTKATEISKVLANVIEKTKTYTMIQGKKYVQVEGWVTLGSMMGVFPHVVWCRRIEREDAEVAYEARVELKTVSGQVVGVAEAMASNKEKRGTASKWADEYAVRSMAQTRATGKAFRLSSSWIMALAGFQPTPSEEMPSEGYSDGPRTVRPVQKVATTINKITKAQLVLVENLIKKHREDGTQYKNIDDFNEEFKKKTGKSVYDLTAPEAKSLIDGLITRTKQIEENKSSGHSAEPITDEEINQALEGE